MVSEVVGWSPAAANITTRVTDQYHGMISLAATGQLWIPCANSLFSAVSLGTRMRDGKVDPTEHSYAKNATNLPAPYVRWK